MADFTTKEYSKLSYFVKELECVHLCFSDMIGSANKIKKQFRDVLFKIRDRYTTIFEVLLKEVARMTKLYKRDFLRNQEDMVKRAKANNRKIASLEGYITDVTTAIKLFEHAVLLKKKCAIRKRA